MKIRCIKIKNFRCFGEDQKTILLDNLTTFIGINSCGKTAVLIALTKLFGRSGGIRLLERSDFHVPKGLQPENQQSQFLTIEAIIDFPELEGDLETAKKSIPPMFEHMQICEPGGKPYVRILLEGKWSAGNSPEGNIEQDYYFIVGPETDPITEQQKKLANSMTFSEIEIIYVPAIRNPSSQLSNASGTILWRILNGINWPEKTYETIRKIGGELDKELSKVGGFKNLQEALLSEWKKLHSDIRYKNVNIGFDVDDLNTLLNKVDVKFSPTQIPGSYKVDDLGEGLRSLFYFSLVSSLLELENLALREALFDVNNEPTIQSFNSKFSPPKLTLLAIEEPENHIAPYLIGRVMNILKNISERPNAQVLVTSHSPAIIRRIEPDSIRYLRICPIKQVSLISSILLPLKSEEKYKYVKEAVVAYPEIYFARLVVLGEGDTEELVIPKAIQKISESLDESIICVVPLAGRFVNHFWKLLRNIDIPFLTFLDLDYGRETGGWVKIQYVITQLIENLECKEELIDKLISHQIIANEEDLGKLHTISGKLDQLITVSSILEDYRIYFATPLDMDFMLLSAFPEAYKGTIKDRGGQGPRIPNKSTDLEGFNEKIDLAIKSTLKSESSVGSGYTDFEKELMIWYKYLFLERGKPATHLLALSNLKEEDFERTLPIVLKKMVQAIKTILEKDPYSIIS